MSGAHLQKKTRRSGQLAAGLCVAALCAGSVAFGADSAQSGAAGLSDMVPTMWLIAPVASVLALLFAYGFYRALMKTDEGTEKMRRVAAYVRVGANAYLRQQYKIVATVFVVFFFVFLVLAFTGVQNPFVPVAFIAGGFFSGLCGWLGMKTATQASARTANMARQSLNRALKVAFRSGAVMGLIVVGFGLLNIALWFLAMIFIYRANAWGLAQSLAVKYGFLAEGQAWNSGLLGDTAFQHALLGEVTAAMLTFGIGASTMALFARVGGGIFTKAADVGADLVGKVEAGIPEDDPRNPATIADNVGDNVGDVAGMGADLYESYVGSILATSALGAALPVVAGSSGVKYVIAPMVVAAIGIICSIAGVFLVRCKEQATQKNLLRALLLGTFGSTAMVLVVLGLMAGLMTGFLEWKYFGAIVVGLVAGFVIGQATEWFTADEYRWTRGVAQQTQRGAAPTIIEGMAVGMFSSAIPVVTVVLGVMLSYGIAGGFSSMSHGLYGVAFAAVGMLSTLGITLASDAYGPVADNAGGNAEMAGLDPSVRERTDALDALGNTTAATGKGFAIGSAALTAVALLAAYVGQVRIWLSTLANKSDTLLYEIAATKTAFFAGEQLPQAAAQHATALQADGWSVISAVSADMPELLDAYALNVMNPQVLGGVFLGAMMAFVFCGMTMRAVGRSAGDMVNEVRRQFAKLRQKLVADGMSQEQAGNPDNWPEQVTVEDETIPNYSHCVRIATLGAQREMILPSLLAIILPILTGVVLGVAGVTGLLIGALTAGLSLACTLNNAGGSWDNAKKWIEKGNLGGKGSDNHKASVVGDTVGDPFKDTSGPSLNILIKLMAMVSVSFAGLTVTLSPVIQKLIGLGGR